VTSVVGFLWVCGVRFDIIDVRAWELVGVYTDRSLALQACRDEDHFVFPVVANIECRCGQEVPAGVEFPLRETPKMDDPQLPRIPR